MNDQPISKQHLNPTGELLVHHIFRTIQGEGPFTGCAAIFIRLYGCNLQCPWCDTEYTSTKTPLSPMALEAYCRELGNPLDVIVFSGGEPMRQNTAPAINYLLECGRTVQVETNGTLFVPGVNYGHEKLTIVCSPKTGSVNKELEPFIDCYKYVLAAGSVADDGLPILALGHPAKPMLARPPKGFQGLIFVNPIDVNDEKLNAEHLRACVASCMRFNYTLGVQLHKIIGLE